MRKEGLGLPLPVMQTRHVDRGSLAHREKALVCRYLPCEQGCPQSEAH